MVYFNLFIPWFTWIPNTQQIPLISSNLTHLLIPKIIFVSPCNLKYIRKSVYEKYLKTALEVYFIIDQIIIDIYFAFFLYFVGLCSHMVYFYIFICPGTEFSPISQHNPRRQSLFTILRSTFYHTSLLLYSAEHSVLKNLLPFYSFLFSYIIVSCHICMPLIFKNLKGMTKSNWRHGTFVIN